MPGSIDNQRAPLNLMTLKNIWFHRNTTANQGFLFEIKGDKNPGIFTFNYAAIDYGNVE